jgi:hypothetical protein
MLWRCEVQQSPAKTAGLGRTPYQELEVRGSLVQGSDFVLQADAVDSISGGDAQASAKKAQCTGRR